jgi:tetratricopeptide (TPR) repeat protein
VNGQRTDAIEAEELDNGTVRNGKPMKQLVRDASDLFTYGVLGAWLVIVALPLLVSLAAGNPAGGLPLAGVVLWFVLLRVARLLSPPARADALLKRGRPGEALGLCEEALAVSGSGAWMGPRRLVWLNRRPRALLALGREDEALAAALEALDVSADPETVGNCALALLRLNRYDEAAEAARLALSLTRERSVVSHAVLAQVMLARGRPAEAEALAQSGLADVRSLLPFVRPEHYSLCLGALRRALRSQGTHTPAGSPEGRRIARHLAELRAAGRSRGLRAVALLEEADNLCDDDGQRERVLSLLGEALQWDTPYTHWFLTQPGTLACLREDEAVGRLREVAAARLAGLAATAAGAEVVAALAAAREHGRPAPARQASVVALGTQIVTLGGTLALLGLWAWRFFLSV